MQYSRLQHLIPAIAVLALSVVVLWISYTQQPAEAFLFPRLIAIFLAGFAVWNFIRALLGLSRIGGGLSKQEVLNILPGLVVMLVYAFWASKALGFYVASTITFFLVYTLYDPSALTDGKAWLRRLFISLAFMAVIYALFAILLKVQTPRGLFF